MNKITYKEDIVREISEELGIPEKEIEEIFNINISYIKKSAIEKDYVLINLPNLCKLRLNYRLSLSSYTHTEKIKTSRSYMKLKSLSKKIQILRNYKTIDGYLLNYKKPLFERLFKKINNTPYVNRIYQKMYNIIYELEKRTNEIIQEII